ncbi:obg-like ATPase 1 isoform X3 [Tachypleus tridentatus]|uniref:obg-like ATPase 1 isoform X3 n=1 Tax=Tachypleus tridentatus TaxID=6853 RepID=UPI003FD2D351
MPPKKKDSETGKPLLIGRVGTNLKVGIVGLPNVGKSTFFNVLTASQAQAENFPFCTIDPNESRVPVPDARFDYLCDYYKPASKVPAFLNVVDIAGLVKGASEGQGLGNAFLSHIKACDAIFHLCRTFEDKEVTHVEGDINPIRDIAIINEELRLKDEDYIVGIIDKMERTVIRGGDKKAKPEYDILCKIKHHLTEEKKHVRFSDWNAHEIEVLNKHLLLTSKPMIYLVNLSEKDYLRKKNKWLLKIKEWVDTNDPGAAVIPFSGAFELKVTEMKEPEEKEKFFKEHNIQSALDKIIVIGYKALQLIYFFTVGKDEVKAWTIQKGTKSCSKCESVYMFVEQNNTFSKCRKELKMW